MKSAAQDGVGIATPAGYPKRLPGLDNISTGCPILNLLGSKRNDGEDCYWEEGSMVFSNHAERKIDLRNGKRIPEVPVSVSASGNANARAESLNTSSKSGWGLCFMWIVAHVKAVNAERVQNMNLI